MAQRDTKKSTKMQNKKRAKPEIISNDEIRKSTSKGIIKGV